MQKLILAKVTSIMWTGSIVWWFICRSEDKLCRSRLCQMELML